MYTILVQSILSIIFFYTIFFLLFLAIRFLLYLLISTIEFYNSKNTCCVLSSLCRLKNRAVSVSTPFLKLIKIRPTLLLLLLPLLTVVIYFVLFNFSVTSLIKRKRLNLVGALSSAAIFRHCRLASSASARLALREHVLGSYK